jgi:3-phenylpropionate/trans-cinnamate dioxygenase ferredoxin component
MSDWVDVIAETALAEGENIVVDVDGTDIALFKIQGSLRMLVLMTGQK